MEVIPVKYGQSVLPESMIFPGGREDTVYPIDFKVFVVNGSILVDAGCETMPGFAMENFTGTVGALEQMGISPAQITDVLVTHAHHDHIDCVKYFFHAVIHICQEELEKGRKYIPEGFRVNAFETEYEISPGVRAVKVGGHSKGSCVAEIADGDKTYVIAGDECYLRANLEKGIPTASSCNKEKSRQFIEKYTQPKYTVLLSHDS